MAVSFGISIFIEIRFQIPMWNTIFFYSF